MIYFPPLILKKKKILHYLKTFAYYLEYERDIMKNSTAKKLLGFPKLSRETVIANISQRIPPFIELYSDYAQIRDFHSLKRIIDHLQVGLSVNQNDENGEVVIARTLQVLGEEMKNTLESPKLRAQHTKLYCYLCLQTRENCAPRLEIYYLKEVCCSKI